MKIKIAIADDNQMLASSIEEKLRMFSDDIEFMFRVNNGEKLIKTLKKNSDVDVILMDIEMPLIDGIKCTQIIKDLFPYIKIIMLTVFDDDEKIFQSIQAGASGYLLKDEKPEKLIEGIKMIMEGGAAMSPIIAYKTLNLLRNPVNIKEKIDEEVLSLSAREIEVLEQISRGLDYTKIAANLFISPSTVRKHIENIYKKLSVHNKVEAVQKALRNNII